MWITSYQCLSLYFTGRQVGCGGLVSTKEAASSRYFQRLFYLDLLSELGISLYLHSLYACFTQTPDYYKISYGVSASLIYLSLK